MGEVGGEDEVEDEAVWKESEEEEGEGGGGGDLAGTGVTMGEERGKGPTRWRRAGVGVEHGGEIGGEEGVGHAVHTQLGG